MYNKDKNIYMLFMLIKNFVLLITYLKVIIYSNICIYGSMNSVTYTSLKTEDFQFYNTTCVYVFIQKKLIYKHRFRNSKKKRSSSINSCLQGMGDFPLEVSSRETNVNPMPFSLIETDEK